MVKKGRYGQFIRGLFTTIDFLILNLTYLILYLLHDGPDEFGSHHYLRVHYGLLHIFYH